jgi:hypothetical protein
VHGCTSRAGRFGIVLFFGACCVVKAQEELTNEVRALRLELADKEAVVQKLTGDLNAARAESEAYQRLWKVAQLRAQTTAESGGGALESARIVEVNPQLRLAVLNVGLAQGARIGMPVAVLHGNRVVAQLQIVEVRKKICGALIENQENKVTVSAGDAARVTKE